MGRGGGKEGAFSYISGGEMRRPLAFGFEIGGWGLWMG